MNPSLLHKFETLTEEIVQPIAASSRRKRDMRDELLAHVWESYTREHHRLGDDQAAAQAAEQCLGNPDDLRCQLQESVPFFERLLARCLGEKENPMYRLLWIAAVVTLVIALGFAFPFRDEVHISAITLIFGLCVWHLRQKDNLALRWLGPRWPWMVGTFAVFFGPAIVMPALAQLVRGGPGRFFFPLVLGIFITLSGLGYFIYAVRNSRRQTA